MVIYQEHCGMQAGLLTDMRPRRTETNERLLVTDRPVPVVWPAVTKPDDPRHEESGTMRPLGIISLGGAEYWCGQVMGYESEALTIVRVDATSVRKAHEVVIGGC